jgi:hypothetical protein
LTTSWAVGEAALALVELQRGDPEVEEHRIRVVEPVPAEGLRDPVVGRVHGVEPVAERGEPRAGQCVGLRVPVDRHQLQAGEAPQQRLGVTAHAHRRVHRHGAVLAERGSHQVQAPFEQHGNVELLGWALRHGPSLRRSTVDRSSVAGAGSTPWCGGGPSRIRTPSAGRPSNPAWLRGR